MKTIRSAHLIALSLGWLTSNAVCATATNPVPLTATQVLDEFARTQDRLLSLAYTVTTTTEEVAEGNRFFIAEVRTDANRAVSRERAWGPGTLTPTSQADPYSYIRVTDGREICSYSAQGNRPGTLNIYPAGVKQGSPDSARRAVLNYNNAGYLFGLFGGIEDRCDIVLRNATDLRVRNQPERVNGVACLVLEARRTHGNKDEQYTLWFDPAHGFHIARAEIRLGPKGESPAAISRVNQVTFHQADGFWVPASAEADSWARNTRDGSTSSSKTHVRITSIRVNPKDNPVSAFALRDVREGSRVTLFDGGPVNGVNKWQIKGQGTWQKGRSVDKQGNVFWTPDSFGGAATNKPSEIGRTDAADKPTPAGRK
jgi:hypothetical protein